MLTRKRKQEENKIQDIIINFCTAQQVLCVRYLRLSCFDQSEDQHSFLGNLCLPYVVALLPVLLHKVADPRFIVFG